MNKTKSLTKTFLVVIFALAFAFVGMVFVLPQKATSVYAATDNYLTFTAVGSSANIIINYKSGTLRYSQNNGSWTNASSGTTSGASISLAKGDNVRFKGKML